MILNEKENIGRYKELFLTYGFLTAKRSETISGFAGKTSAESKTGIV